MSPGSGGPLALLRRRLPILDWGAEYSGQMLGGDLVAAAIVSMMLIPQSLAYALLVGLPPQLGLYASMAPLLLYAVFGTSRALAVGPVAVASLMTGAAAAQVAAQGTPEHLGAAVAIAMLTGILMVVMGFLRLGFLANFLSHPVVSGFITAAAVQIAAGQIGPLLGVRTHGESLVEILASLLPQFGDVKPITAAVGVAAVGFLLWAKRGMKPLMLRFGLGDRTADITAKAAPAMAIVVCTAAVWALGLDARGVGILGDVPAGLPKLALPPIDVTLWTKVLVPSLLICIVGYVESISVALTLAAKRRQRVDPDQELIALGVADIGSAVSGGFPVTGALSRSVVNFDAGAQTPAAGAFAAIGVGFATLFLTPLLFYMPKTALGAIIIVAVLSLVDLAALRHTWEYSRAEFAAMTATILVTWAEGVESGLIAGVGLSIFLHLYATSRPHVAIIGQIPGTAHFRNVERHAAVTSPEILSLRVDASLYFPNARFIEDLVNDAVAANPGVRHVILECLAVNTIDMSALESLEAINRRLADGGIALHLSAVKGPVMDRLKRSHFLQQLTGSVHLSHFDGSVQHRPRSGAKRAPVDARTRHGRDGGCFARSRIGRPRPYERRPRTRPIGIRSGRALARQGSGLLARAGGAAVPAAAAGALSDDALTMVRRRIVIITLLAWLPLLLLSIIEGQCWTAASPSPSCTIWKSTCATWRWFRCSLPRSSWFTGGCARCCSSSWSASWCRTARCRASRPPSRRPSGCAIRRSPRFC